MANFNLISTGSQRTIKLAGELPGFFVALVAVLWAYDGWTTASMIGSDIKNPEKNLPRSLIWGTLTVIAIYLLANVAYLYVLSAPEVAASPRVAADMMRRVAGGFGAGMVSVAAIVSMLAALNGVIISGSRIPFAMAQDGYFFAWVGKISQIPNPGGQLGLAVRVLGTVASQRTLRRHHQDGDFYGMDFVWDDNRGGIGAAQDSSGNAAAISGCGGTP